MSFPRTLGELRHSSIFRRTITKPAREGRIARQPDAKLRQAVPSFRELWLRRYRGAQIINAVLSRHNFILLGLRGQAKSRILRALTTLLDPQMHTSRAARFTIILTRLFAALPRRDCQAWRQHAIAYLTRMIVTWKSWPRPT